MRDCTMCKECEFYQFDVMVGDTPCCTCGHPASVHASQKTSRSKLHNLWSAFLATEAQRAVRRMRQQARKAR